MSSAATVAWWRSTLVGIPLCLLANGTAIFAVVESPYGSLGFFDDTPTTSDWLLPMSVGVIVGVLQVLAFGKRTALIADGVTLLVGLLSFLFIFPTLNLTIGCALAVAAAALARRGALDRRIGPLPVIVLIVGSVGAVSYGIADHTPPDLPAIEVLTPAGGPAVLVDVEERLKSTWITGTLANVDGCLGLTGASVGDGTVLVLWRSGTTVSSAPYEAKVDGKTYQLGNSINLHGGGLLTDDYDLEAYRPDMPASCRRHDLFL